VKFLVFFYFTFMRQKKWTYRAGQAPQCLPMAAGLITYSEAASNSTKMVELLQEIVQNFENVNTFPFKYKVIEPF